MSAKKRYAVFFVYSAELAFDNEFLAKPFVSTHFADGDDLGFLIIPCYLRG